MTTFIQPWCDMFTKMGWTEEQMMTWHRLFEKKYPDKHQSFLEWLGLEPLRIEEIRRKSQSA